MSQTRKAVLVVAMFVVSAVAVASASAALPEFEGPFPNKFTALQLTEGELETVGKRDVRCTHGSASGTIKSEKDVLVNGITYTGCKSTKFGGEACQSGAKEGEITTKPLLGLLNYIKKAAPIEVGLLFESDEGLHFATFNCKTLLGSESLLVKGVVICPLSPVNTITKEYHLNCLETGGIQKPLSFEGGPKNFLQTEGKGPENFAFEQSGVKALSDVTLEKAAQIKA